MVIWKPPSPTTTQTSASGLGKFRSDGCGQSEAHGAESAGSDESARAIVVVILRFPHLVLAHIGDDNGLAVGFFPEIVDHVSGVEMAVSGRLWISRTAESPFISEMRRCHAVRSFFSM